MLLSTPPVPGEPSTLSLYRKWGQRPRPWWRGDRGVVRSGEWGRARRHRQDRQCLLRAAGWRPFCLHVRVSLSPGLGAEGLLSSGFCPMEETLAETGGQEAHQGPTGVQQPQPRGLCSTWLSLGQVEMRCKCTRLTRWQRLSARTHVKCLISNFYINMLKR